MKTERTEASRLMDDLQAALRPMLKQQGFRERGRTFNRLTADGLTQVVNFQMGSFDPPGTTYIPGFRENLYGKFTMNVGIYVPEVARYRLGGEPRSFVQEYYCCLRERLGNLGAERRDLWWDLIPGTELPTEIERRLVSDAFPFLERFASRELILHELLGTSDHKYMSPPRIVCAIILAKRGLLGDARRLLVEQSKETRNPGHPAYVRGLAERLGLGALDA